MKGSKLPRTKVASGRRKHPTYEELLHFFNESADLLCIAGFDGVFKRLNPIWHSALGWTLEELQARPFLGFVHPDDRFATLAEMDKLALGATTITFENRYQCKDGSWKWLQWTSSPLPNEREIYAIARDVTRQKRLEEEILNALDSERERVGRDLHDGLCQELAGIAALSASLARRLELAGAPGSDSASEIGSLLGQAIAHARDLARGANPAHLETAGLEPALADFCDNTGNLFKVTCGFQCSPQPEKLESNVTVQLYRITQEAVQNALAHGRAKQIDVSLTYQDGRGILAVQDDGFGIASPVDHQHGIGLHTMAYRARLLGATLDIRRRSPRGTVMTCVFPLS